MDLTQVSFSQIRSTFHVNTTATMPLRDESPRLVGIADKTAVKWAALAARDWSGYISDRAR